MILVTGATGFVGSAVVDRLIQDRPVRAYARTASAFPKLGGRVSWVRGDIALGHDWGQVLDNVDSVVHCAARAHVMGDTASDPLAEYRKINTEGTLRLAQAAADAGVRRFVFISSVKVNGEETKIGLPFRPDNAPAACDAYGISKLEAEVQLRRLSRETGMEVVVIRPPLVYGPGVRANFLAMMRWLERGVPLPFASVKDNRRSLVSLDNLVDLIVSCVDHPAAANETFLVSDDEDLSTADLLRRMGRALGRPTRLFALPPRLLYWGASLAGRPGVIQRLCGSLQVDISYTKAVLGWRPPYSVDAGLKRTAEAYVSSRHVR